MGPSRLWCSPRRRPSGWSTCMHRTILHHHKEGTDLWGVSNIFRGARSSRPWKVTEATRCPSSGPFLTPKPKCRYSLCFWLEMLQYSGQELLVPVNFKLDEDAFETRRVGACWLCKTLLERCRTDHYVSSRRLVCEWCFLLRLGNLPQRVGVQRRT